MRGPHRRNNWLFVGSDDGAEVNTTFATLIASRHMHGIEPEAYLRDVLCLLPTWPTVASSNWRPATGTRLASNPTLSSASLPTSSAQPSWSSTRSTLQT